MANFFGGLMAYGVMFGSLWLFGEAVALTLAFASLALYVGYRIVTGHWIDED